MVTEDGLVKVLDFGLAKLMPESSEVDSETATVTKATQAGTVLGTVQYMSPEQASNRPLDFRSDQFSLGSILYEMATGKLAFKKDTMPQTLAAIIENDPEPIRKLQPEVPVELEAIIKRCLAKDPAERYELTTDLARELKTVPETPSAWRARRKVLWAAAGLLVVFLAIALGPNILRLWDQISSRAGPATIESIAVLPLQNLSGDPEQEYFADGMTEALITDLAKIGALKVISRSSAMRYKGTDKPLPEIARELNVDVIVEGSAQQVGGSVRVMAQLIDPETEQALWAESYERDLENVLLLWSEVAQAIAGEVRVALTPEEANLLASARPVNHEAHDAYLKGSYHWKMLTREGLETAQSYFELALEKDPSYAAAYAGLAWVWADRQQMGITPPHEAGPKGKAAALQAIALDDSSPEAYGALGVIRTWTDWDWDGAGQAWRRALELNPRAANTHAYFAHLLAITGRAEEAVSHSERSIELDPFETLFHGLYAMVLYLDRRYDDAIGAARTAQAMEPDARGVSAARCWAHSSLRGCATTTWPWTENESPVTLSSWRRSSRASRKPATRARIDASRTSRRHGTRSPAESPNAAGFPGRPASPVGISAPATTTGPSTGSKGLTRIAIPACPTSTSLSTIPFRSDPRFQDLLRRMNLPTTRARSDPDEQR